MNHVVPLCLAVLLALAGPAAAEPWPGGAVDTGSESLHYTPPEGFELGFEDQKPNLSIRELVPGGQTVEDWADMVTILIIPRPANLTIEAFFSSMSSGFADGCEIEAAIRRPELFLDGPYRAGAQTAMCGRTTRFGRAEGLVYKAILGETALYVVQRAWRFPPQEDSRTLPVTEEMLVAAGENLLTMQVCDSTVSPEPCPAPR